MDGEEEHKGGNITGDNQVKRKGSINSLMSVDNNQAQFSDDDSKNPFQQASLGIAQGNLNADSGMPYN